MVVALDVQIGLRRYTPPVAYREGAAITGRRMAQPTRAGPRGAAAFRRQR